MKISYFTFKAIIGCFIYSLSYFTYADQEIDFSDETIAKDILLDKTWSCYVFDITDPGYVKWRFEKVNGNKVHGSTYSGYCPGAGILRGKLKKNTLKYSVQAPLPCDNKQGQLKFSNNRFEGVYRHTSGAFGRTTKIVCEVAPPE